MLWPLTHIHNSRVFCVSVTSYCDVSPRGTLDAQNGWYETTGKNRL